MALFQGGEDDEAVISQIIQLGTFFFNMKPYKNIKGELFGAKVTPGYNILA